MSTTSIECTDTSTHSYYTYIIYYIHIMYTYLYNIYTLYLMSVKVNNHSPANAIGVVEHELYKQTRGGGEGKVFIVIQLKKSIRIFRVFV